MNIQQALQIDLVAYLASLGHHPAYEKGDKVWYHSPFRTDDHPSFKVNRVRNQWYDFGMGEGGGIIPLAKRLFQTDSVSEVLRRIEAASAIPISRHNKPPCKSECGNDVWKNVVCAALTSVALLAYLDKRGIPAHIAVKYCREISYELRGRRYFTVGFLNDSGGYELRNAYFKGCMGKKDVTILRKKSNPDLQTCCCHIFEGFLDYLSYIVLLELGIWKGVDYGREDFIILNSVSTLGKVMGTLGDYDRVFTYLDNDDAGKNATALIAEATGHKVCDIAFIYDFYNDVNDFLCAVLKDREGK